MIKYSNGLLEVELMFYFSYGSNMSIKRIRNRIPLAKKIAVARLQNHELKFHKIGKDGSGKCDIELSKTGDKIVFGVVFDIDPSGKRKLDQIEGLGNGYAERKVEVKLNGGDVLEVMTYCATHIDAKLKPYSWYKEHVLRGAKENDFPDEYIRCILNIETMEDPRRERQENEMAIYF